MYNVVCNVHFFTQLKCKYIIHVQYKIVFCMEKSKKELATHII